MLAVVFAALQQSLGTTEEKSMLKSSAISIDAQSMIEVDVISAQLRSNSCERQLALAASE